MTDTIRPTEKRAPSPPERRRPWWRTPWLAVVVAFVVAAAVAIAVAVWPDDDADVALTPSATATPPTQAPPTAAPPAAVEPGALAWGPATKPPSGQVLAVTATDTGYLAAAHTADGVAFWVSDDGDTWTLLAADPEAFRPNYQVYVLDSGPGGFTAEAFDPTADLTMGSSSVFASTDGAAWYRTELVGDLLESPSPYVIQHSVVHGVTIGAGGFLAVGSGSLMPDFDLIAAEYAPGYTAEDVWAVDAERRADGAVLIIGFGDEAPLEIPFSELGIEAEHLAMIFEEEGDEGGSISQFMWWSADGQNWETINPQGLPDFWLIPFMAWGVGTDDGFYVFAGGPDPYDPEGAGVTSGYHSADGRVWTQFELDGPTGDWMHTVSFGNGMFVAAGEDEAGRALWTSTDARVWERAAGSGALFDLGYAGDYAIEDIGIGDTGFVAVGRVHGEPEMYPTEPIEPEVVKDGYAVVFGDDGITVTDQATGEVEVFDMESGRSPSIEVRDDETGLTFVDIASGDTLFVITNEEVEAAWNALAEEVGMSAPPVQVFRYSTDLATWTLEQADEIFGEGTFAVSGDVEGDTVVVVAASDMARWEQELDRVNLPPTVIWVGRPGG